MQNNSNVEDEKSLIAYRVILDILKEFKINSSEFCSKIGVNPSYVSDAKNGKTRRISEQVADKIIKQWPELSKIWLLTGEGSKYSISTEKEMDNKKQTPLENNGIFINHGGGGDTFHNNTGFMQLALKQQQNIQDLIEFIKNMSGTISAKAKIQCFQTLGKQANRVITIKNVGMSDALNIRFTPPEYITITDGADLFPFPKIEPGRSIELCYFCTKENRPPYIPLDFFYISNDEEQKYTFYLTL